MKIRHIEEKYFEQWLNMRYALWSYHTKEHLKDEMEEIYKTIEKNPVYLAEDHDSICGFIELSIHEKAPGCATTKIGFIEGWYVKSEYRQLGIGKMLVEAGEHWARNIGCTEMASDTTERYPISPRAHIALEYEEVNIPLHFKKTLSVKEERYEDE